MDTSTPLDYLCKLGALQLPLETMNKIAIGHISKLAALGLLLAEVKPDFMRGHASPPDFATVLAITETGRAQIAEAGFPETIPTELG